VHNIHQLRSGQLLANVAFYDQNLYTLYKSLLLIYDDGQWKELEPEYSADFVAGVEQIGPYLYATSGVGLHRTLGSNIVLDAEENDQEQFDGIANAYPNPFNDRLSVSVNLVKPSPIDISVVDFTGRKVFDIRTNGKIGANNISVDRQLTDGLYLLNVKVGRITKTMRVVRDQNMGK